MLQHVAHEAHAPQHQKHAQRRRRDRQREAAGQSAPHEAEAERRDEQIVDQAAASTRGSDPATRRPEVPSRWDGRSQPGLTDGGVGQHLIRGSPDMRPAPRSSVCGNSARISSRSCSTATTVRPCRCHSANDRHQIGLGRGVDGTERFVQQNDRRVAHDGAGEQHALELPGGQRADRPGAQTVQADRGQGAIGRRVLLAPDAAEQSQASGPAQRDDVSASDRKRTVEASLLRQQRDRPGVHAAARRYGRRPPAADRTSPATTSISRRRWDPPPRSASPARSFRSDRAPRPARRAAASTAPAGSAAAMDDNGSRQSPDHGEPHQAEYHAGQDEPRTGSGGRGQRMGRHGLTGANNNERSSHGYDITLPVPRPGKRHRDRSDRASQPMRRHRPFGVPAVWYYPARA